VCPSEQPQMSLWHAFPYFPHLANAEKSDFLMPRKDSHRVEGQTDRQRGRRHPLVPCIHYSMSFCFWASIRRVYKWCCIISHNIIPRVNQMSPSVPIPKHHPKHNISNPRPRGPNGFSVGAVESWIAQLLFMRHLLLSVLWVIAHTPRCRRQACKSIELNAQSERHWRWPIWLAFSW